MEDLPVPLSRVELYLAKACGMDVTVPEAPENRLEQYLAILAGDTSVEMPAPMNLTEQWLAYVLGVTPDPLLAVEGACYIGNQKVDVRYFAVAAGMPGAVLPPAPQNRKEQYFANLNVGPSGVLKYATGTNIALTDVVRGIEELQYVYGNTYQQTYSGKNMMPYNSYDADNGRIMNLPNLILPIGTFTISFDLDSYTLGTSSGINILLYLVDESGASSYDDGSGNKTIFYINSSTQTGRYSYTFTTKAITHKNNTNLRIGVSEYDNGARCKLTNIQIEVGSTPTSYEPYTGGIPAPNPDYPQAVQTVTGEQTVAIDDGINTQYYTVNLGSIELCKIGDYQDYIYKSGDDWYVHKEFGKIVLDGSEEWVNNSTRYFYTVVDDALIFRDTDINSPIVSNYYPVAPSIVIYNRGVSYGIALDQTVSRFRVRNSDFGSDVASLQSWLSTHNTTVYYALSTPTDTKITDATLISQLNAVNNATLPTPVATISVTTDGTSLPGSLKISYYGEEE